MVEVPEAVVVVDQYKRTNLTDIIYQYKENDFTWGQFDCCIFTVQVIEEFINNKLPHWRDVVMYKDYKGAMKALKVLGCDSLEDLPSEVLNTEKKDISKVKLGEPVYYINEDNIGILGVCNGKRAYFLQREGGLTARNVEECEYCWSIDKW